MAMPRPKSSAGISRCSNRRNNPARSPAFWKELHAGKPSATIEPCAQQKTAAGSACPSPSLRSATLGAVWWAPPRLPGTSANERPWRTPCGSARSVTARWRWPARRRGCRPGMDQCRAPRGPRKNFQGFRERLAERDRVRDGVSGASARWRVPAHGGGRRARAGTGRTHPGMDRLLRRYHRAKAGGGGSAAIAAGTGPQDQVRHDISHVVRASDISQRELALKTKFATIFLTLSERQIFAAVLDAVLEHTQSEEGIFGYIDEEGALVFPIWAWEAWEDRQVPGEAVRFRRGEWVGIWGRAL